MFFLKYKLRENSTVRKHNFQSVPYITSTEKQDGLSVLNGMGKITVVFLDKLLTFLFTVFIIYLLLICYTIKHLLIPFLMT